MTSFGFDIPIASNRPAAATDGHAATAPGFALVEPCDAGPLLESWKDLCGRALTGNPFMRPEFLLPAIAALGHDRIRLATVGGIDGRLLALAPIEPETLGRIAPAVRVWCHRFGPSGTPLIDRDFVDHALSCLVAGLSRHFGRTRAIVFPFLATEDRFAAHLRGFAKSGGRPIEIIGVHRRAYLRRGDDPTAILETRRRKEFARQRRRLGDCGHLVFEAVRDPAPARVRFEEFLALEANGWKGRQGTAIAQDDAVAGFARQAVLDMAEAGHCQIDSIRLDNRPVAILVSLTAGDLAATWKIAYDEAFARFSPGAQLMLEAPQSLVGDPMVQRIDSLAAADHPMIDRLWRGRLEVATMVLTPPEGWLPFRFGLIVARTEAMLRRRFGRTLGRLRRGSAEPAPRPDQDSGLASTSAQ